MKLNRHIALRASVGVLAIGLGASPAAGQASGPRSAPIRHRPLRVPDSITGTARTQCGTAISSFVVNAYGYDGQLNDYPTGLPPLGKAKGRHGRYLLHTVDHVHHRPVNALVRSVEATATLHYQGHRYVLPLSDGRSNDRGHSGRGLVRNLTLRTSGVRPGDRKYRNRETVGVGDPAQAAFYGASVLMFLALGDVPGQTLSVHFAPMTRRLADGCPARAFDRSITLGPYQGSENLVFQNIPLGFYRLTATLRGSTTQTVRLALDGQNTTTSSVPLRPLPTTEFEDGSGSVNVMASLTSSPYG